MRLSSCRRSASGAFVVLLFLLFSTAFASAQAGPARCEELTLLPAAPAYQPGERIDVVARGSSSAGAVTGQELYYARVGSDFRNAGNWTRVASTSGAGTMQTFFNAPATPGEYVLVSNVTDADGHVCTGNPGFPGAGGGITVGNGIGVEDRLQCAGCRRSFIVAPASGFGVECSSIALSPQQRIYDGSDTIRVSVQGSAETGRDVSNIQLYFARAEADLRQANVWHPIDGSFNAASNSWSGTIQVERDIANRADPRGRGRMGSGEYIIAPNVHSTSGRVCGSNPGYETVRCPGGIGFGGDVSLDSAIPCNGCARRITVDVDTDDADAVDLTRYWNLEPGNFWHFSGVNRTFASPVEFEARVEIEAETMVCGVPTTPMRFLKDRAEGYWGPRVPGEAQVGDFNLRFLVTNDGARHRFHRSISAFGWKAYHTDYRGSGGPGWYGLGERALETHSGAATWFHTVTTNAYQHQEFGPYLLSLSQSPLDTEFAREDMFFRRGFDETEFCHEPTRQTFQDSRGTHGWRSDLAVVERTIPGLGTVEALRVKFIEYGGEFCSSWVLREDYFLVEGVGLVELHLHRFDGECGAPGQTTNPELTATVMQNPDLEMTVTGFYDGRPMEVEADSEFAAGGSVINLTLPNRYEGPVQRELTFLRTDGSTDTIVDDADGVFVDAGRLAYRLPSDGSAASVTLRFRPFVSVTPSSHETVMGGTSAAWSQPLELNVVDVSVRPQVGTDAGPGMDGAVIGTDSGPSAPPGSPPLSAPEAVMGEGGCSSSHGTSGSPLALLVGLLWLGRRRRR